MSTLVKDRTPGAGNRGRDPSILVEEPEEARIERLGRQRPERLASIWTELGFVFSITMAQVLTEYFVSGFVVLIPTVVEELNIPSSATMARECILPGNLLVSPALRQGRRHLWRLSRLRSRMHLDGDLGTHRWLRAERAYVGLCPCFARLGSGGIPTCEPDLAG